MWRTLPTLWLQTKLKQYDIVLLGQTRRIQADAEVESFEMLYEQQQEQQVTGGECGSKTVSRALTP